MPLIDIVIEGLAGSGTGFGRSASVLRVLKVLRVLRTARIIRVARYMPELMILIKGLMVAARSVFFTLVLLLLITYIFSITNLILHSVMPDQEGFYREVVAEDWYFGVLYVVFIMVGSLIIMNMLVGVLVEAVQTVASCEHEQIQIDFAKRERLLEKPDAVAALQRLGVDLYAALEYGKLLFEDGQPLTFGELLEGMLMLRGSNQTTVKDLVTLRKFTADEFGHLHTVLAEVVKRMDRGHLPPIPRSKSSPPRALIKGVDEAWKACWKVFRAILFMLRYPPLVAGGDHLKVVTSACLEEYYDRVSKLNQDFPETWHLIMKAEDKCRSEMFERFRHHLTKAAADNRLPMGLDFLPNQPWIGVFTYAARNREFWDEHVIGPATMFIARGGRNMTMDKAEKPKLDDPQMKTPQDIQFERPESTRKYKFLELFAGKAGLSREVTRVCGNLVEVLDPLDVQGDWNVLEEEGFARARQAVLKADHTHLAFPCRSFSRARRVDGYGAVPVIRTDERPEGWGHPTAEEGNRILEKVIALIYVIEEAEKTWSMENPERSYAWDQPKMKKILKMKGVHNIELDQCPYGAHTKKGTRIVTTSDWMSRVKLKCEDVRPHFHLPGGLTGKTWDPIAEDWVWKTSRAAEYPFGLCQAWAEALLRWLQSPGGYEWLAKRTMVRTKAHQLVAMKEKLNALKRRRDDLAAEKMKMKEARAEDPSSRTQLFDGEKTKAEIREEENFAAVGGLRDPRKAVANSKALRTTGHRIRSALELCIGEQDLKHFEHSMAVRPETVQKAVQVLHEEFEVNEATNIEGYQTSLLGAMLEAACDADAQTAMIEAFKYDMGILSDTFPEAQGLLASEVTGHTFRRSGVKELARKNTPLPLIQFFARHSSAAALGYVEEAYEESPDGNLQVLNHLEMRDQIAALSSKTNDMTKAYDQLKAEYEELAAKCNLPLDRSAVLKMFNQWSHPEVVINLMTGKTHSTAGNAFRNHPNEWVTACGWPWIAAGRIAKAALEPSDMHSQDRCTPCERCRDKLPEWARPEAIP
eukprot:g30249.t1